MHDEEGLACRNGGTGREKVVPEIPLGCRRVGVVGTVGLVGDGVQGEAHRTIGRVVDLEVLVVGGTFGCLAEEEVAGLAAGAGSVIDVGTRRVVVGVRQGATVKEHVVHIARDDLEGTETVVERARDLEGGVDHDLTRSLVVVSAVIDHDLAAAIVEAPLAEAEVRCRHGTRSLDEHAFPLLHRNGARGEDLRRRERIALAEDGGGDGVAAHTHNLGQAEVLTDLTGQAHEVPFRHGDLGVETEDAAVSTLALLNAEQAAIDAGHNAADGHQRVGEDRRIQCLSLLDGRDGDGAVHDIAAVVVDDGGGIVVVRCGVRAAQLLEVVGVARLDAVAETAVDGTGDAVAVAEDDTLVGVTVVAHIVHRVVAAAVVDGELTEVVELARHRSGDLAQHALILLEVGVGRGEHGRGRKCIAAVEDGGGGGSQLGATVEAAHRTVDDDAVAEGNLRAAAIEQAAADVDEDAAPGSRSILDGGVAAVHARDDTADIDHLAAVGAVIVGPHVLLDGTDGDLGRVDAAAVIGARVGVVVGGLRIRAAGRLHHRAGVAGVGVAAVSFEGVVEGVVVVEDDPLTAQAVAGAGHPIAPVAHGNVRLAAQCVVCGCTGHARHVPAGTRVAVEIAYGVHSGVARLRSFDQHEAVIAVGEEVEGVVRGKQQQGVGLSVDDQVRSEGIDGRTGRERVPEFVFTHHGRRIAHVWERVAAEVDGGGGGVVDLQVFVVRRPFSVLAEEEGTVLR